MAVALTVFFFIVVAIGFFSLAGNLLIGAFYVLGKILPVLLGSVATAGILTPEHLGTVFTFDGRNFRKAVSF